MKIESIAVSDLIEDPSNVRKHSQKNLSAIKGSLAKFGQQKPIVVDKDNVVLAGNGTLAAAKALGWKSIFIVRSSLSDVEAVGYAIADNRTGELAEWDDEGLARTLREMHDQKWDLGQIGFDVGDLKKFGVVEMDEPDDTSVSDKKEFLIVIECDDELHQRDLFEELNMRELKCKIM